MIGYYSQILTRWFDFVQHIDQVNGVLPLVSINKNLAPEEGAPVESKQEVPQAESKKVPVKEEKKEEKKKEEEVKVAAPAKESKAPAKESKAPANQGKKEEKKEGQQKQDTKQPKGGKQEERSVDVSRLDIRVGKIVNVKKHDTADSLYVEEIDIGEPKPRTVVSGLVKFIPIEEMQNRVVVVLTNLKPAKLRGVTSEAMVLAASNADHTQVELLEPSPGTKIGERCTFDGYPGEADAQLNPKLKIWEAVQPDFATTDDCTATWKGIPFKTSTGVVKVKSIAKGTIK